MQIMKDYSDNSLETDIMVCDGCLFTSATVLQLSPLMVAEEVGYWLETTGCLDLLTPTVVGALECSLLEHVILTSLARHMAMWCGMLYRFDRHHPNGFAEGGPADVPQPGLQHHVDSQLVRRCRSHREPAGVSALSTEIQYCLCLEARVELQCATLALLVSSATNGRRLETQKPEIVAAVPTMLYLLNNAIIGPVREALQ